MMHVKDVLVRRYAEAFLNVYGQQITHDHIKAMQDMYQFLKVHQRRMYLLQVPTLTISEKIAVMMRIADKFSLAYVLESLIRLLVHDKRIALINDILAYTTHAYYERAGFVEFEVMSACSLTQEQKQRLVEFLEQKTEKKINIRDTLDVTLLAGIRLQSDSFLWEYSVRKQLQQCRVVVSK